MGLVFDVVDCGAVDAGVVDAGEHQHLLVGFVAHHAGHVGYLQLSANNPHQHQQQQKST